MLPVSRRSEVVSDGLSITHQMVCVNHHSFLFCTETPIFSCCFFVHFVNFPFAITFIFFGFYHHIFTFRSLHTKNNREWINLCYNANKQIPLHVKKRSMPKCIDEMRKQAEEMSEIYYVYVVDDDERLKGVLPLQKLITHPSVSKIKHVMKKDPISVRDSDSIEEVTETIEKYDLVALPVVDSIGRLVGRITIDDVMDEVREQHERDYQLASGISQDVETSDNVFTQTAARLPWLLIGMIGGLGNSVILGGFESSFATNPKMALFIPLIGGTGGNVGIQSSAIVVQGLANNTLKEGNIVPQILKESVVSLINASIISLVVFIYNFFMLGDRGITASVSLSLFAVVMFASIFGTLVPMTLDKMKIDPALATGPFITITNDIIGMMIYMFITSALA